MHPQDISIAIYKVQVPDISVTNILSFYASSMSIYSNLNMHSIEGMYTGDGAIIISINVVKFKFYASF